MKGLVAEGNVFYLDDRPLQILSGSFHYFRTIPAQWKDRLLKMKAAGLNTVMTYIPWNLHEETPGNCILDGYWSIPQFINSVQEVGLHLIIRPGPFICAEWEYGGLPHWLLRQQDLTVRNNNGYFVSTVSQYFETLLPLLAKYTYKRGGPIIAFQIENEYGSYGLNDPGYLQFLESQYLKHDLDELFFTSDGGESYMLENGSLPDILETVNFKDEPEKHIAALQSFQPNKPVMVTEFWCGWFDHWGDDHHREDLDTLKSTLDYMLKMGVSINFYMFVGGTNFAFWNGANFSGGKIEPTITSYDYDAPISESGTITSKYNLIRDLIQKYTCSPMQSIDLPTRKSAEHYGSIQFTHCMPYTAMVYILEGNSTYCKDILPMELTNANNGSGQRQGWILYRTTYKRGQHVHIEGMIRDRAQVFVDGVAIGEWNWFETPTPLSLPQGKEDLMTLDIFVENVGRVNFKNKHNPENILNEQHKGIIGHVRVDDQIITEWKHVPFEFNTSHVALLDGTKHWLPYSSYSSPAAYYANLDVVNEPQDTFIDVQDWNKGIVLVNGFNIGRYWTMKGPQRRLYIPGPLLMKGMNSVIIFELHKPHTQVIFHKEPHLG